MIHVKNKIPVFSVSQNIVHSPNVNVMSWNCMKIIVIKNYHELSLHRIIFMS
jgi:hypothetical protein